jgi:hypothetical protein
LYSFQYLLAISMSARPVAHTRIGKVTLPFHPDNKLSLRSMGYSDRHVFEVESWVLAH